MSYFVPQMPLECYVWRNPNEGGALNYLSPDQQYFCNLTPGKRLMFVPEQVVASKAPFVYMQLLLPKLADVRAFRLDTMLGDQGGDFIEVPKFSNRIYQACFVDDIGKGFANEHRICLMLQFYGGVNWSDVGYVPWPEPLP
jgi:hypothetical protein